MAVPKKKTTRSARNQRRSHHALKKTTVNSCPNCQEPVLPHHVCTNCGNYQDKQVMGMEEENTDKKSKNKKGGK